MLVGIGSTSDAHGKVHFIFALWKGDDLNGPEQSLASTSKVLVGARRNDGGELIATVAKENIAFS